MSSEETNHSESGTKKGSAAFAKGQFAFSKAEKGFTQPLVNQPSNGLLIYANATMGIAYRDATSLSLVIIPIP